MTLKIVINGRSSRLLNDWSLETGLPSTHQGKIATSSVGVNYKSQLIHHESSKFKTLNE